MLELIYFILNIICIINDASIKKLNNIYIDANTGYELNGTMIGFNLLDKSYWTEHVFVYQVKNKLYAVYAYNFDDGFRFTNYNSHANIIYI